MKSMPYRQDGSFTIVQFTDIHWQDGGEEDLKSRGLMERVLDHVAPDLVVFTGDVIYSHGCKDPIEAFRQATAVPEQREIPWAAVFGNHDTESGVTREQLMEMQISLRYCSSEPGPQGLGGVGNYAMKLQGAGGAFDRVLYFFDSGAYSSARPGGYAEITREQIHWYVGLSSELRIEAGVPVPALAFLHIPLPEYKEVWTSGPCVGSKYEDVCSPLLNTGLFAAMVQMGDMTGVFCGHDHVNDYIGELHGIRLGYGRATGYNTYGKEGFPRGARVIRLKEGHAEFDTWLLLDRGQDVAEVKQEQPAAEAAS